MANQSPDRRKVLELLAKVAAVSQFGGFVRWVYADQSDVPAGHAENQGKLYRPQFFSRVDYDTVDRLTELIIPADDTPGAHEAGVAEFIDFMAAGDAQIQEPFRVGLGWLDAAAKAKHGDGFVRLQEGRQVELLRGAAADHRDTQGGKFFHLIREYTMMGYYTSRIGLQQLDYPGLKMYAQSPACPHKGDPEHKHLTAGKS